MLVESLAQVLRQYSRPRLFILMKRQWCLCLTVTLSEGTYSGSTLGPGLPAARVAISGQTSVLSV